MQRNHPKDITKRLKQRLRQTDGVIDLASIVVGVIIIGVISTGIVASTFTLIPFTQDRAAQQALSAVQTAEGAAYVSARPSTYLDMAELVADDWIQASNAVSVATGDDGSCYAAMSLSPTGKRYWTDSSQAEVELYVSGTSDSDCVSLTSLEENLAVSGGSGSGTGTGSEGSGSEGPSAIGATSTWASASGTFREVKASSNGMRLIGFASSTTRESYMFDVVTSNDGGASWTSSDAASPDTYNWQASAISNDGMTMFAAEGYGSGGNTRVIKKSTDGGSSWSLLPAIALPTNHVIIDMEISGDGSKVVVTSAHQDGNVLTNGVWISNNGGTSFTQTASAGTFRNGANILMSDNGQQISLQANDTNLVRVSTDGGATWVSGTPEMDGYSADFQTGRVAMNGSGSKILMLDTAYPFQMRESADGGLTWTARPDMPFGQVSMSSDGSKILISDFASFDGPGTTSYSSDGGATFTDLGEGPGTGHPTVSEDGSRMFLNVEYGNEYYGAPGGIFRSVN